MAMKVVKSNVHRLTVEMSCGCKLYAEFKDPQCKEPLETVDGIDQPRTDGVPTYQKTFTPCAKHVNDSSLSMLEFIIGERLDEAVEEAKKTPVHLHPVPGMRGIEDGDSGGVTAVGENVQSVVKMQKPAAVGRNRPEKPPGIKTLQRSPEQLASAGAAPKSKSASAVGGGLQMANAEMDMEEAPEDERITPHIEEALDFLDPKEHGLLDDSAVDEDEG